MTLCKICTVLTNTTASGGGKGGQLLLSFIPPYGHSLNNNGDTLTLEGHLETILQDDPVAVESLHRLAADKLLTVEYLAIAENGQKTTLGRVGGENQAQAEKAGSQSTSFEPTADPDKDVSEDVSDFAPPQPLKEDVKPIPEPVKAAEPELIEEQQDEVVEMTVIDEQTAAPADPDPLQVEVETKDNVTLDS